MQSWSHFVVSSTQVHARVRVSCLHVSRVASRSDGGVGEGGPDPHDGTLEQFADELRGKIACIAEQHSPVRPHIKPLAMRVRMCIPDAMRVRIANVLI